ncbi:flagellar basal-body MS-ring/collar protein FliF [Pseudoalteromonas byunsanensis]|uniref:Flagellar M-ring protein n=1 Tax=Pseudoalteromonas byunsanensis TaxID=327939 RepID=A0A1S1NC78_9GAMM|nr:flagellar basal-body MS-ring/collar protein FliF [Pseudoalteromonas byunsanensis]OHU97338.1 flagellar M-ring protein FliF [Pseudoalteromonas byunsanensis]
MSNLFTTLTAVQKRSLMVLAVTIVAFTVAAVVWVVKASYQPVHLKDMQQSAAIIEKFEQNNLDYKYTANGELLVNQEQLGKSQLLLEQAQGSSFSSHGLELFDKTDYGMTEHAQKVTFQRAMQGELERTLSSLSYIRYARVHLTMADKRLFSADSSPAKASVTLFTEPGYEMTRRNISGIQSLVSAAVEGLSANQVTVFSEHGKQLSRGAAASDEQEILVGSSAKEAELIKKVEKLLALYMMPSQFAVSASVELSHKKVSSVEKSVLAGPDGKGVVVRKKTSSRDVPKADSDSNSNALHVNEELEYTVGSKTQQSTQLAGDVEKISIAVALNVSMDELQITKLKTLLSSATGLDKARGDTVAIEYFEPLIVEQNQILEAPKTLEQPKPEKTDVSEARSFKDLLPQTTFPVLLLLLIPLAIVSIGFMVSARNRLPKKERQEMLHEVSQWLEKQESGHAR